MLIIGCDYHPGFQQIAFVDSKTGELRERRLAHREEAEQFYTGLKGQRVRVGMEASVRYARAENSEKSTGQRMTLISSILSPWAQLYSRARAMPSSENTASPSWCASW